MLGTVKSRPDVVGFLLLCTAKGSKPRSVMSVMVGPSLPPCDTDWGGRQWASPFSISGVCPNPVHRVMVNWDPPFPR